MTCHRGSSSARLVLLVLLTFAPQLADAAPVRGEGLEGGVEDSQDHTLSPPISLINTSQDRGEHPGSDKVTDDVLAALLEVLDHPSDGDRDWRGGGRELPSPDASEAGEIRRPEASPREPRAEQPEGEGGGADKTEQLIVGPLTAAQGDDLKQKTEEEDVGDSVSRRKEENQLESFITQGDNDDPLLQRKTRGYFQNIDLGLQDNEILPPLKGYKAYNTQLARAGKKLHWQDDRDGNRPVKGGNFMDDFEDEGEELEEVEEEEESLSRIEEEARAQAEKQEVLRQQEEAERAREEEQRLADIASDMLLQYMGRKQQSYMKPRQKSSMGNAAEDKRSEEIVQDEDDMDQQMIDRLIEISSKLHLPADDVIEIISDVEEKKKKRKELQQQPVNMNPITPRFRPLVPPPLAGPPPIYHYTASKNPKKQKYNKSNKKWHKDKVKSYKQDYWYKPQKQIDYWYKPQKQFLAFPSYPYYQKPYRAYYPVYFPYPKSPYYGKPPPPRDQLFGPQELDLQPPRRKNWIGGKNRGQGWRQQPAPRLPITPYISNYILPHPRTYQSLPAPKPISQPRRGRRPPYYPPVTPGDDYEEDGLVPQLDSEEELENFIERIYMKRRMY